MATSDDSIVLDLIEIALGVAKDVAYANALEQVKKAQREYLLAQAEADRVKSSAIILSIAKISRTAQQLEIEYARLRPILSEQDRKPFEELQNALVAQRRRLVQRKNRITGSGLYRRSIK